MVGCNVDGMLANKILCVEKFTLSSETQSKSNTDACRKLHELFIKIGDYMKNKQYYFN